MLLLSIDDAVKVAKRLIADNMDDDEIIRQEMEQKCWFPPTEDEAAKRLNDLIFDITPAEICSQIESDNLRNWCNIVQTEMKMAMVQLPKTGKWIRDGYDFPHGNDWIHCSVCGKRGINVPADLTDFCPNCGSKMVREDGEA